MDEKYFYSPSTGGFYLLSMKPFYENSKNRWPDDAIQISEKWYKYLVEENSTRVIIPNDYGQPILSDTPPLTSYEKVPS